MYQINLLKKTVIISIIAVLFFPLYASLFLYPSFNKILSNSSEEEAVVLGRILSSMLLKEDMQLERTSVTDKYKKKVNELVKEFNIIKIKTYSSSGEVIFSTDQEEIGKINKKSYFHDIVAKGNTHTFIVNKDSESLDGKRLKTDVVETYVPILEKDIFIGAFEIYYDITGEKASLNKLIMASSITIGISTLILFFAVILSSNKAKKSLHKCYLLQNKLKKMSYTDELTGLYNRRGFFTLVDKLLKTAKRQKKEVFILYADLDYLKRINDLLGHKTGDLLLIRTANILMETFRESDIIARIGGDEFVIFGFNTSNEDMEAIATRLKENINKHNDEVNEPLANVSLSFGFVKSDYNQSYSIDELLSQADSLMYADKMHKNKIYD